MSRGEGNESLEVASFKDNSGNERFEVKITDPRIQYVGLAPVVGLRHVPSDTIVATESGAFQNGTYTTTLGFKGKVQPDGQYEILFGEAAHRDLQQPTWPRG
jgi:hypothetical protein